MSYGKLFALVLIGIVAVSGCMEGLLNQGDNVVCKKPYMRFGTTCCMDYNDNGICDGDEPKETTLPAATQTTVATIATTTSTLPASTTTQPAPTTTVSPIACSSSSDCGSETSELRCSNGDVIKYVQTPMCQSPGTASARCINKVKTLAYENCASGTTCSGGACVSTSAPVTCMSSCQDLGISDSYCSAVPTCVGFDVASAAGNVECATYSGGMYCCCGNDAYATTTTTLSGGVSTTTTLGFSPTHKECVGTTCKYVAGFGPDQCTTNIQCMDLGGLLTTTTVPLKSHYACVGTTCKLVLGAGVNECTSSLQCKTMVTIPDLGPTIPTIPCIPPYC